jgi:hypothetical protein
MSTEQTMRRVNAGVSDWYDRGCEIPARSAPVTPQEGSRKVCPVKVCSRGAAHHIAAMIVDRGDGEETHAQVRHKQDVGDEDWARQTLDQHGPFTKDRDDVVISETDSLPV